MHSCISIFACFACLCLCWCIWIWGKNNEKGLQKIFIKLLQTINKIQSKPTTKTYFSWTTVENERRISIAEQVDLQDGNTIVSIVRIKISRYNVIDYDAELADGVLKVINFSSPRVRAGILKELHWILWIYFAIYRHQPKYC